MSLSGGSCSYWGGRHTGHTGSSRYTGRGDTGRRDTGGGDTGRGDTGRRDTGSGDAGRGDTGRIVPIVTLKIICLSSHHVSCPLNCICPQGPYGHDGTYQDQGNTDK